MSEDDLYELADPDDAPTPPPPPKTVRSDAAPDTASRPIELDDPTPQPPAEKRPKLDLAAVDDGPSDAAASNEPLSVSPAKARRSREDQRRRAAMEQAEADARKQKRMLITGGAVIGLAVVLWLWFKLF